MPGGAEVTVPIPAPAVVTAKVCVICVNVAMQPRAAFIVTLPSVQSASPLHPPNVEPALGVAVSVTTVPTAYIWLQSTPQLIPAGLDVTDPDPVPLIVTASVLGGITSNVAVQLRGSLMVTLLSAQSAPPLHPANVEPASGLGMRLTIVPCSNDSEQSLPQVMPGGFVVTVPDPLPAFETIKVNVATGFRSNVAVQLRAALILTLPSLQSG